MWRMNQRLVHCVQLESTKDLARCVSGFFCSFAEKWANLHLKATLLWMRLSSYLKDGNCTALAASPAHCTMELPAVD
jgi:hypothetical protein